MSYIVATYGTTIMHKYNFDLHNDIPEFHAASHGEQTQRTHGTAEIEQQSHTLYFLVHWGEHVLTKLYLEITVEWYY